MVNFLDETIKCLQENGKAEKDVLWVGRGFNRYCTSKYKSTWEDFQYKANFMYDECYGDNKIPMDLVIVGKDFWLERHEYDGAEWCEFKTLPKIPSEMKELTL